MGTRTVDELAEILGADCAFQQKNDFRSGFQLVTSRVYEEERFGLAVARWIITIN